MITYIGYFCFMQMFTALCMTHNCRLHYSNYFSSTFKLGQAGTTSTFRSQCQTLN